MCVTLVFRTRRFWVRVMFWELFIKLFNTTIPCWRPSWLRSYGSWICNYLCNQCLSLLKLWVLLVPHHLQTQDQCKHCQIKKYQRQQWMVWFMVEPRSWRGILDTTLCDKVCQWLAAGRWFSPGTQVSSTNKTDRHEITEILLKSAKHHTLLRDYYAIPVFTNNSLLLLES
jgi:hypothetical protein